MKRTLTGLAILAALAGCFGCQRSIEPKAQAQVVTSACVTDAECEKAEAQATPKEAHYCAGITKAGVRCRKHVKAEGDYCWMHESQDKRKR